MMINHRIARNDGHNLRNITFVADLEVFQIFIAILQIVQDISLLKGRSNAMDESKRANA
jgi:hypothetical protein